MNQKIIDGIWKASKGGPSERLVLLALACKDNGSGEAMVEVADLCSDCRLDDPAVRAVLKNLRDVTKEIVIFHNHDSEGQRLANTYRFVVAGPRPTNGEEEDIDFSDPPLPGISVPKVKDLPKEPQPKLLMDAAALAAIAADPLYKGLDVTGEAWKFKRWCVAHKKPETVQRFKVWLARV
jgi:thiol-disulfide isomerase/thioredoxin